MSSTFSRNAKKRNKRKTGTADEINFVESASHNPERDGEASQRLAKVVSVSLTEDDLDQLDDLAIKLHPIKKRMSRSEVVRTLIASIPFLSDDLLIKALKSAPDLRNKSKA